ncbi:MAG: AmmeMemoRadiSam system radical SAM enzyme [Candidatus Aenigmatarchaeota archaeon]
MQTKVAFKPLPNKAVRCLACSHGCTIAPGRRGICGVRKNVSGRLELLVYGKPVSLAVDPVEKKPLFHFLPGSRILSFGTLGCNFSCSFCQNWEISQASKQPNAEKIMAIESKEVAPQHIVDCALRSKIPSIAFTYNEPTVFLEYALDVMKLAKKRGLKNVWVSNGFMSREALETIAPYLDAINIDLKSFSEDFYRDVCKARLEPVLNNIRKCHELGIWVELTTLLIPGKNDSDAELEQAARFIASVSKDMPWHISAFHPDYKMQDVEPTPKSSLMRACKIGKAAGLNHVYVGNVADSEHSSTFCPKCGEKLIERSGNSVTSNRLNSGACPKCKTKITGVWK